MISEVIRYTNLDGKVVEETYHFGLDRAELAEMKIRHEGPGKGTLEEYLDAIVKEEDNNKILDNFKAILFASVGIRVDDYVKKDERIRDRFVGSGAYEATFMRMLGDAEYAAHIINGIVPADMAEAVAKKEGEQQKYTDEQLLAMTDEAFFEAAGGSNPMRWDPRYLLLASRRKTAA